jgi:PPM family protein phosphatase
MSDNNSDTAEYPAVESADSGNADTVRRLAKFEFGAVTHPGKVRPNNEDHYCVVRRTRSREILLTNVDTSHVPLPDDHAHVLIVADGIGGHGFGELASELVLKIGWELAGEAPSWLMKFDPAQWPLFRQRASAYAAQLQEGLKSYAAMNPRLANMGTTWTCVYALDADALIAHVGDSRVYLFRGDTLRQLTRDDTLAQELRDMGMPPEEAAPFKHILTNSMGGKSEHVRTQVEHVPLENGDRLLLCTDGLTDMVADDEIRSILRTVASAQGACDALIAHALGNGGKDNVTVVLANFERA